MTGDRPTGTLIPQVEWALTKSPFPKRLAYWAVPIGAIAVICAVLIVMGPSRQPVTAASTPQVQATPSAAELEAYIQGNVTFRQGSPRIVDVDCEDVDYAVGAVVSCIVVGESGQRQTLAVTIDQTAGGTPSFVVDIPEAGAQASTRSAPSTRPSITPAAPTASSSSPRSTSNTTTDTVMSAPASSITLPLTPSASGRPAEDLGLAIPITTVSCDGTPIVLYASAITPGAYLSDVQAALDAHPGSSYLRTDQACSSLTPSIDGEPIYAVFRAYPSVTAACAAEGPGTSVRLLDQGPPDLSTIDC